MPLLRDNVDTDAIIPSREMKKVSRSGLAEGLFAGWRYEAGAGRKPDPAFALNDPRYANASILASGANFGCGSSREHAVWALSEYGFRAILAPSFASIFERNCVNNGIVPIRLGEGRIAEILGASEPDPQTRLPEIDLVRQRIRLPGGREIAFSIQSAQREMLLNGWDPIDQTLQAREAIERFEQADRARRPWAYRP